MDEKRLLPCPFCGGEAQVIRYGTSRQSCQVGCTECHCELESNEQGAGDYWNRRAGEAALRARLAAAERVCKALDDADTPESLGYLLPGPVAVALAAWRAEEGK